MPICLSIALYLRFANGRLAAYVQGLAIFPMFVPSIILSYAIIRVLGPNGTVDLLLERRRPAEDPHAPTSPPGAR